MLRFGCATIIGGFWTWRGSGAAIWETAMVGGLADIGTLMLIDLSGFANVFPGAAMIIVAASAILSSVGAWVSRRTSVFGLSVR